MQHPQHLRTTFDAVAERYDRVRPRYPSELFDDIAAHAGLAAGNRVLELGCGTGQATVGLAERGFDVTALELGSNLAAVAHRRLDRYPNVEIVIGDFDAWSLPPDPFDAVISANAFHWMDSHRRVSKAFDALRPGGQLAVIDSRHSPIGEAAMVARLRACDPRSNREARVRSTGPQLRARPEAFDGIEGSGQSAEVVTSYHEQDLTYTTEEYLDLVMTYSHILALEPTSQKRLRACVGELVAGELGGHIGEHYVHELLIARKNGSGISLSP